MVFKIDMHTHTGRSADSRQSLPDMIRQAKKAGLDGFAVCDHDLPLPRAELEAAAFFAEKEYGVSVNPPKGSRDGKPPFYIIGGIEITTLAGHILGLFLENPPAYSGGRDPEDALSFIRENGGISILAHPFQHRTDPEEVKKILTELSITGVERFNARAAYRNKNANEMARAIADGRPFTAGSDAHLPEEIGRAYLIFEREEIPSLAELKEQLLSRNVLFHGVDSPAFLIGKSQMIKQVKEKSYHKLFRSFLFYLYGLCKK